MIIQILLKIIKYSSKVGSHLESPVQLLADISTAPAEKGRLQPLSCLPFILLSVKCLVNVQSEHLNQHMNNF